MILVIGLNNFLGLNLVKKLLEYNSRIKLLLDMFDKVDLAIESNHRIIKYRCDLENFEDVKASLDGVSCVYNLYNYTIEKVSKKKIYDSTVCISNVVNAMLLAKTPRLIHISSVAALTNRQASGYIYDEDIYEYPMESNLYGICHYEANREVFRGIYEGLNASIIYVPLFLEDTSNIKKLVNYYKLRGIKKGAIVSLTKLNSFMQIIKCLSNNKLKGSSFVVVDSNISITNLIDRIKPKDISSSIFRYIKCMLNKYICSRLHNKLIYKNELAFWSNNESIYMATDINKNVES